MAGLSVLVAEDDEDARDILTSLLTHFGAHVQAVRTTTEALSTLQQWAPDVVIADMILGRSDGFALLRQARKNRTAAPFIAVSGRDFDPEDLKTAGFASYLRKPLDHKKLVETIVRLTLPR